MEDFIISNNVRNFGFPSLSGKSKNKFLFLGK